MILLEPANKILQETLEERLRGEPEKVLVNACDFDGVAYRLSTPVSKSVLVLSMRWSSCWPQLLSFNVISVLQRIYGSLLLPSPESGFDISLSIDLAALPAEPGSNTIF